MAVLHMILLPDWSPTNQRYIWERTCKKIPGRLTRNSDTISSKCRNKSFSWFWDLNLSKIQKKPLPNSMSKHNAKAGAD